MAAITSVDTSPASGSEEMEKGCEGNKIVSFTSPALLISVFCFTSARVGGPAKLYSTFREFNYNW